MPSILSQEAVFKEFNTVIPADIAAPMRPHIAGPEAELRRYDNAAEKALISLGAYDPDANAADDYPGLSDGSVVNLTSVAVFIDDALLQYFENLAGAGDTIAPVAGYLNRLITNAGSGFKANGATYPRLTALKDRDVAVGDVVHLQDGANTQATTVAGLVASQVNPVTGAATSDPGNAFSQPNSNPGAAPTATATGGGATGGLLQAGTYFVRYTFAGPFGETAASPASTILTVAATNIPRVTIPALPVGATSARIYLSPTNGTAAQCTLYQTGVVTVTTDLTLAYVAGGADFPPTNTQISGTANDISISAVTTTAYNGSATGDITETYTIEVTTAGAPAAARLSVTSASGRDDAINVTPAAFASPTAIGARGLTVTFANTASDFVVGQTWELTVRQAWTASAPTAGGTYTGDSDVTYIATVSRGGLFADAIKPQITVTTNLGTDLSGPTTVTAAASAVSIGTLGITLAFSALGLNKGDIYYAGVTGPTDGAYKTILLTDNLSTALQGSTDMTLTLYLKKNITVPARRLSAPPALNWVADADGITINAGIDAKEETLTDGGVEFWAPVKGGTVYVSYNAWVTTHAARLLEASDQAGAEAALGMLFDDIVPAHGLPYAVKKAIQNSNGQSVKFSGVADPDNQQDWDDILAMLAGYNDIFTLVPLSRDPGVIAAYQAHIAERSAEAVGGEWRHGWFNLSGAATIAIVDETFSSDDAVVMATLGDNPADPGTQYTTFSATTGNGKFVTNGVLPGDEVRYLFTIDAFGEPTYTSFTVEEVVNEDTLIVETGHTVAVAQTQKIEVHRAQSKDQIAASLAATMTGDYVNSRFKYLWPDQFTDDDGLVAEGYHLCAMYAAMISGIAPQQGLRSVAISGVSAVPRSTSFLNNGQLNTLAGAGFVVVSQAATGEVYALYARTPDLSSVAAREEATARLDDAIRYLFWNRAMDNRGNTNLTGQAIAKIRTELQSAISHGVSDTDIQRIGPMLESATIIRLTKHLTIEDRLVLVAEVTRPFPLNDTTITLSF